MKALVGLSLIIAGSQTARYIPNFGIAITLSFVMGGIGGWLIARYFVQRW